MPAYKMYQDVQLKDCDPTGIVFLPRYFEMMHSVVESWFDEALDWPMSQLLGNSNMGVPLRKIEAEFPVPSRLGDRLAWRLEVRKLGSSSMDIVVEARATQGGDVHLRATGTLVLTDIGVLRTRSWPEAVRNRVSDFLVRSDTDPVST